MLALLTPPSCKLPSALASLPSQRSPLSNRSSTRQQGATVSRLMSSCGPDSLSSIGSTAHCATQPIHSHKSQGAAHGPQIPALDSRDPGRITLCQPCASFRDDRIRQPHFIRIIREPDVCQCLARQRVSHTINFPLSKSTSATQLCATDACCSSCNLSLQLKIG